jgi:hypothetical protein
MAPSRCREAFSGLIDPRPQGLMQKHSQSLFEPDIGRPGVH